MNIEKLHSKNIHGVSNMLLIYSGSDIDFLDTTYNIEGECHQMNIPTGFYPDGQILLAGKTTVVHRKAGDTRGIRRADYIGDNYLTILELIRKDNGK